jgi:hypothetical protein
MEKRIRMTTEMPKELGGFSILTEARVGDGTTVLHLRTGVVLM